MENLMGEIFQRFRARANLIRILRAVLTGLGAGALLSGVLNLLARLELLPLSSGLPFLIGGGVALAVGVTLFLLVRTDDRSLARMLDSELSLDERVETMHQYKDGDSALLRLQREDAEAALSAIPTGRLRFKRLWLYLLVFVLGAAVLATSFLFKKEEEPPVIIPEAAFELSAFQEKALLDLALEVEASGMQDPYRTNTVTLIRGLVEALKAIDMVREKDAAVSLAMSKILSEVDASSYAVELITALYATSHAPLRELALALNYYDWPRIDELDKFNSEMKRLRASLTYTPETDTAPAEAADPAVEALSKLLTDSSSGIVGVLEMLNIPDTDPLYKVLLRLATAAEDNADGTRVYGLTRLAALLSELGYEPTQREIDATLTALSSDIYAALLINRENTSTGEMAVERIAAIMNTPLPSLERPRFSDGTSGGGGSSDEETGGGGAISGGTEYGSDDLVYDPYTNSYVPYGEVLDRYYALIIGGIENGDHTEEERAALMKYFSILYGGFEEGEENNE